ncbi:hypothetical protein C8Q80DRAFT_152092 [Daedaleopsis nitida]|nr:hypothetical protein C8Q80DRAFT_152092 [Daedaleopsis nitida]
MSCLWVQSYLRMVPGPCRSIRVPSENTNLYPEDYGWCVDKQCLRNRSRPPRTFFRYQPAGPIVTRFLARSS